MLCSGEETKGPWAPALQPEQVQVGPAARPDLRGL